jgi:hypothetical protein
MMGASSCLFVVFVPKQKDRRCRWSCFCHVKCFRQNNKHKHKHNMFVPNLDKWKASVAQGQNKHTHTYAHSIMRTICTHTHFVFVHLIICIRMFCCCFCCVDVSFFACATKQTKVSTTEVLVKPEDDRFVSSFVCCLDSCVWVRVRVRVIGL